MLVCFIAFSDIESMKNIWLFLAIFGFIAPNIFVFQESLETGNILLYANPNATVAAMFANTISTAFIVDLLFVVMVFVIWTYGEAKQFGIKKVWIIWLLTMLFGIAGAFPLFLYLKERVRS